MAQIAKNKSSASFELPVSSAPSLPPDVWAYILRYISTDDLSYGEMISWSTISRIFFADVPCLVMDIKVTSPHQMYSVIARQRFGGVRNVAIDCLFAHKSLNTIETAVDDTVDIRRNQTVVAPCADSFSRVIPFLASFPRLETVTLGGHAIIQNQESEEDSGRREFRPLSSINSSRHGDQDSVIIDLSSTLVTSICCAYRSGSISPTVRFPQLLSNAVCPNRARSGGIILPSSRKAQRCQYCTHICRSFPQDDVKDVLLDSYEDSIFDRVLCLSSKTVLEILASRKDGGGRDALANDIFFFMNSLVRGRHTIIRAMVDMDLLPQQMKCEEVRQYMAKEEVDNNNKRGGGVDGGERRRKFDISRALFNCLVEKGIPLREEDFDITGD